MKGGFLHSYKSVQHDQLDVVVTLLHDELYVGGGCSFHSSWGVREGDQGASSFVANTRRARVEKVVDAANEPRPLARILVADTVDELHNDQLQDVTKGVLLVNAGREVGEC